MRPLLVLALLLILAPAASAGAFPDKGNPRQAQVRHLATNDGDRTYLVQPVAAAGHHPIVILLHGGTQTAQQIWRQTSLPTLGQQEGFIVVAPQGVNDHWNDGRGATIAGDKASTADDIGFIKAIIYDVTARDGGDATAVFIAGPSNGGFMAMYFACQAGSLLRAGANLIANLPADQLAACKPAKPLPWLSLNGTDDPLVPFNGQPSGVKKRGQVQPALASADQTFAFWADRAGCAAPISSEKLPDLDPRDGSWVERRLRAGCAGGTTSVQYVVHGGGHITPGLTVGPVIARMLGGANQDIDTGTVLWAHFKATLR
ncbi:alpha/beta hydrolase family esterase [Oleomonas cavernae]|nr:PHB depolymerase family esterase [Oleomonas cavernae]